MNSGSIVMLLIVGLVAGWLARILARGRGFGLVGDIGIGLVGAIVGSVVVGLFGITRWWLPWELVTATAFAVLFIVLIRQVKKPKPRKPRIGPTPGDRHAY